MQNAELKLFPFDAQDVITASTPIVADNLFRFSGFDDNTPKNLSVTYNGNTIFDRTKTPDASINVFFCGIEHRKWC